VSYLLTIFIYLLQHICDICYFVWNSYHLKSLDPFSAQKESAFTQSLPAVATLASYVLDISTDGLANKSAGDQFSALFHVCF